MNKGGICTGLPIFIWADGRRGADLFITAVNPNGSNRLKQEDARWVAQRLQPSQNTGDPASWPRRAVG